MNRCEDYLATIIDARRPADIFGDLEGTTGEKERKLYKTYRRLAKATHGDRISDPRGNEAFVRLKEMYDLALEAVRRGSYDLAREPVVIRTRIGAYEIEPGPRFGGKACDYYGGTLLRDGETEKVDVLVKMARFPGDNTSVAAEEKNLRDLFGSGGAIDEQAFFPEIVERFAIRSGSKRRAAIAFVAPEGRWFSLYDVRREYGGGVDPKDIAWMYRRVLYALGVAHMEGLVHGAVFPEHILIEPDQHGVMLIDWKYAVPIGSKISRIPKGSRDRYPPEVIRKEAVGPATDIAMVARVMLRLNPRPVTKGGKILNTFFGGCTQGAPVLRPNDAGALLEEFDELIGRLWGDRRFHPFAMP